MRHPDLVAAGRHYGLKVETCVPYDPETSQSGLEEKILNQLIQTHEQAESLGFRGSPTILIEGRDPFAAQAPPVGLACPFLQN